MDKQEITTFIDLYVKFQKRCEHVAEILSEYNRDFDEARFNIWKIDYAVGQAENKFDCYTEIESYVMDCFIKSYTLSFPADLLSADDSQIHEYASSKYKKV